MGGRYRLAAYMLQIKGRMDGEGAGGMRVNPVASVDDDDESITEATHHHHQIQEEEWLPITEERKGKLYYCVFHLVNSGVAIQVLALPLLFPPLGWFWGVLCLCVVSAWQLYTKWILVQLHESPFGTRYSRYLHLSIAAFGPKLGKLLALFPVLYHSGGTCIMLIIVGGGAMKRFYHLVCESNNNFCAPEALSPSQWFLIFICLAVLISQFLPNLNSVAWVSFVGAIAAVAYCSLIWVFTVIEGRPSSSTVSSVGLESEADRAMSVVTALGVIAMSFRGHNLVLEIQGTLPENPKLETRITMWKAVMVSFAVISMCTFPLAISGYWAYGTLIPSEGILVALAQFHGHGRGRVVLGTIYLLQTINSLCAFQIYCMPSYDNLEMRVTGITGKRCSRWQRAGLRVFFGGLTLFIAFTFPFLPKIAALTGGIALPLTFAYPCFMWNALYKAQASYGRMYWFNMALGCTGVVLGCLVVASAIWYLVNNHFHANFFHPN